MKKTFSNMRIGTRLGAAFAAILALVAILTTVGFSRLHEVSDATKSMDGAMHKLRLSEQWRSNIATNNTLTEARLRAVDAADDEMLGARMKKTVAKTTKILDELKSLLQTEEGKRLIEATAVRRKEYVEIREEVFALKTGPNKDQGAMQRMVDTKMLPAMAAYEASVADVTAWQEQLLAKAMERVESDVSSGKNIMIGCGVAALILGGILAWLLSRSITAPLRKAVAVARQVAGGDLSASVTARSTDETGQLMAALHDMTQSLNKIVGSVRSGSDTIATASAQLASGNLDLSARTEEQASSIEETAASIEELSTTVKQNAENAHQGNQVATSASEIATKGGAVVARVVDTMGGINSSARKIADIISVIDGIAFQTNILALNAAVEAARAGEQGRGFAVVAGEVRTLAQRSAAAAKEIKALIDDSVSKVDAGSALVNEAGATILEVVESVQRVSTIMSEIALASQEQSEGIQQVNQAIRQMDQVTQQNAALVEEAAAATESMQAQSRNLTDVVQVFKLSDSTALPSAPARHPAASPAKPKVQRQALAAPARRSSAPASTRSQSNVGDGWEEF
jgi:methyl-accepting chemotaxis protein